MAAGVVGRARSASTLRGLVQVVWPGTGTDGGGGSAFVRAGREMLRAGLELLLYCRAADHPFALQLFRSRGLLQVAEGLR